MRILFVVLSAAAIQCTLLKYDSNRREASLETLTERSIYQALAFVHTNDHTVSRAATAAGPVGEYARKILQTRAAFHRSPELKQAIQRIFAAPDAPPLAPGLAAAQDRLYARILLLCPPGPARAALIRYAVYRREGVPLGELQAQLLHDPDFRAVNTEPSQSFLGDRRFAGVLRAFEQDIVDMAVTAAEAVGSERLKRIYVDLALAQLDAQITVSQDNSNSNSDSNSNSNYNPNPNLNNNINYSSSQQSWHQRSQQHIVL